MNIDGIINGYFLPYQINWIRDQSKFAVYEKSRRVGITFCEAFASIIWSLQHNQDCWFSSTDIDKGKEFIILVKEFCKVINGILEREYIDLSNSTTERVCLPNGKRISCLSSNPTSLRGLDGRITLDEFAMHENQDELYRAAKFCVLQKGCVRLISTHNGAACVFYKIVKNSKEMGFSHHRTTIYDAVKHGYAIKFAKDHRHLLPNVDAVNDAFITEVRQGLLSEDHWKQECMCEPLSLSALIPAKEYDDLTFPDDPRYLVPELLDNSKQYRSLHIGIDVGRTQDLTVLWAIEQYENPTPKSDWDRYDYKTVCVRAIKNEPISTQYEILRPIMAHPSVASISVDIGLIGRTLYDLALSDFPNTVAVNFSNKYKAEVAERMKGFIQFQKISLPNIDWIRDDFLAIKRLGSPTGAVLYDGNTRNTHCDSWWSACMALDTAVKNHGSGIEFIKLTHNNTLQGDRLYT